VVEQALPKGTTVPPAWSTVADPDDVSGDWLKSFADPGLNTMVAEAIANNLDLRQAAARVEVARQTVVVVGARMLPQVGVHIGGASLRAEGQDGSFQSNAEYAGVVWEVDLWGRLRAQRAATEAGFEASALDYAFARQSLAATTAQSWYLAIETRQLLALAEQSVAIYSELLDLVRVRRAAGKVADLDVAEASANLNSAQSQFRIAQGNYSEARRNLEVLAGRYPAAELEVAQYFAPLPPAVPAGLPSSLLARRPDLIAAEQQVVAAFRTTEAARLALLPSIALTLDGGRLGDRVLDVLRLNPWLVHAVIGMKIPIYEGGALMAQIEIATAQQAQTVAQYGAAVLAAFNEVEGALTNQQLLAQRLPYQHDALADRSEAVRIARVKYEAGAIDMLSVLQLQEAQLTSEADLVKLRNAQLANRIQLHLALGGSFDSAPAAHINAARD